MKHPSPRHPKLLAAAVTALAVLLGGCLSVDHPDAPRVWAGAYVRYQPGTTMYNTVLQFEWSYAGTNMDTVRLYDRWDSSFPSADHVRFRDRGTRIVYGIETRRLSGSAVSWASIASASPGSSLHNEMVSKARKLRDFRAPITVVFNHEPEETRNYGRNENASQFKAAFNKFGAILEQQNADNVQLAWVLSAWSFYATDSNRASDWYPGDRYVDVIGTDGYNWGTCRRSDEGWRTFSNVFGGFRNFGAAHRSKPLLIAEVGSVEDRNNADRKAAWIRNMADTLQSSGWGQITSVLWFNSVDGTYGCDWRVQSSTRSINAFKAVLDRSYFGG
jgi:hypothetical protein